jgi:hypothetical protein
MVRAMILEPGKHAEVRFICPKKIAELVDGCPEFTAPHKGICIAVNEEGKIKGLPLNRSLVGDDGEILDIFAGTMVILGCNEEEEIHSLTDEQVVSLLAEISRSGKTAQMKELLSRFGASKLSDVKPEDYAALLAAAKEVKNA